MKSFFSEIYKKNKILKSESFSFLLRYLLHLFTLFLFFFLFLGKQTPFNEPYCTVIKDRDDNLLGAHIASDGQYRFPPTDSVLYRFSLAITTFEDKRFFFHHGFDLIAICRAALQNIQQFKIVSGGSTISMQVIRLSRKGRPRNMVQKVVELFGAFRLELWFSKADILALYASHAPFGGNVVGLDAASWRYFGRPARELSWAESVTLAVLPNNPAMIHPGRNRELLLRKRNSVLLKLKNNEIIDEQTYTLALDEALPEEPEKFPQVAPHLLTRVMRNNQRNVVGKQVVRTSVKFSLQKKVNTIFDNHFRNLSGNGIFNGGAIVIHNPTNQVFAYVGNIYNDENKNHCRDVDVVSAPRSTGSILKPLLYAGMLTSGDILPDALVPDIPIYLSGYSPKNYNRGFDGAVKANRALARSLNVPAIMMLQRFGLERFHLLLRQLGMTTITRPASHYGLTLVLGGCEGSLFDLVGIYSSMARSLSGYTLNSGKYDHTHWAMPNVEYSEMAFEQKSFSQLDDESFLSASAIWFTFKAMVEVERPGEENAWREFTSSRRIAWKTGTSFGFRDAWAIGVTPEYTVGVWVGNADGEGRPELVGVKTAAPILFDIFGILPSKNEWFDIPYDDMCEAKICRKSGFLASVDCPEAVSKYIPKNGLRFDACPYHKIIHLDKNLEHRVNTDCESIGNIISKSWFVLPPAMEWYYRKKNSTYKTLPPLRDDCLGSMSNNFSPIDVIYPKENSQIYIPLEIDGEPGKVIFEIAHRKPQTTVFWYVDEDFVGQTSVFHKIELAPPPGKHCLTLVDEQGNFSNTNFEILNKDVK